MSAIEKISETDVEFDDVVEYFNGDKNAAIRSLLSDVRNLWHMLSISEHLTSKGPTRGWKPSGMGGA